MESKNSLNGEVSILFDSIKDKETKKKLGLANTLLEAVQKNDEKKIAKLVKENEDLLSYEYSAYDYQDIIAIASNDLYGMDKVKGSTLELLINCGAESNKPSKNNDFWEPLHYTALNANEDKMTVILEHIPEQNVNSLVYCSKRNLHKYQFCKAKKIQKTYSNNALNILLRYGNRENQFYKCCELLYQAGINTNQQDSNGVSPADLARKIGEKDKKLKSIFKLKGPNLKSKNVFDFVRSNSLNRSDLTTEQANSVDGISEELSSCTLLQLCCAKGSDESVDYLLEKGAQINKTIPKNPNPPIMIAIYENHENIVKKLIKKWDLQLPNDILLKVQKMYESVKNISNVEKYMRMILKRLKCGDKESMMKFLNETDDDKRNVVYYGAYYKCWSIIFDLIEMGGSLVSQDKYENTPFDSIEPNILCKIFNKCITVAPDYDTDKILHTEQPMKITIDYSCLVSKERPYESEFLDHMLKIPEGHHLMNHPLVTTFLAVKWHKMKWPVYINLALYLTAYVCLLLYGFVFTVETKLSNSLPAISLFLVSVGEIMQILIFKGKYFKRLENLIDLSLIGGLSYVVAASWLSTLDNHILIAYSIVFLTSTLGIFTQLGNLSPFTKKVLMLEQIALNFFKYMAFYLFPILAFFFCFYMLTKKKDDIFFETLYRTITMYAGDPDTEFPESFHSHLIFGHLVYVVFIVLIGIIVQNLLIGLAVSDLQAIQKQADFIDKKERSRYIVKLEKMCAKRKMKKFDLFGGTNGCVLVIKSWDSPYFSVMTDKIEEEIRDRSATDNLQGVVKNLSATNQQYKDEGFILKSLHKRVEKMENLLAQVVEKLENSNQNHRQSIAS